MKNLRPSATVAVLVLLALTANYVQGSDVSLAGHENTILDVGYLYEGESVTVTWDFEIKKGFVTRLCSGQTISATSQPVVEVITATQ